MNCPEHLVAKAFGGRVWLWLYWRDVPRKMIPLRVWLSPLRYQITINAFGWHKIINQSGHWHGKLKYLVGRMFDKDYGIVKVRR